MRILIDLQGAQNDSKNRGIGRYSLAITQAIVRQRGEHEVWILLNAAFAETIDVIRKNFADLLPDNAFRIFNPLSPTHTSDPQNIWRRNASELLYEHAVAQLQPDVLVISAPMDGWGDQTISSIHKFKRNTLVVPILYDLIPLIQHSHGDLEWSEATLAWYLRKVDDFRRADWVLTISESSKSEAVRYLGFPAGQITNVSAAAAEMFHPVVFKEDDQSRLKARYHIRQRFIMVAAAFDKRKNPENLIRAFALLPRHVRKNVQLLFVGAVGNPSYEKVLISLAERLNLAREELIFVGHITDNDLIRLYAASDVFVFPSFHEGFGLPALEAMACGAPTIASNTTSLPEVMGWDAALFDPHDPQDIARSIEHVLTDRVFRQQLVDHGLKQAKKFSWDRSARLAITALESAVDAHQTEVKVAHSAPSTPAGRPRLAYFSPLPLARSGIADFSAELLPELSKYYEIEVIIAQTEPVKDFWVTGNAPMRSVAWFERHAHLYDRILYQFGNSEYHVHMFDLLERYPGVVVLHDFYLSDVIGKYLDHQQPGVWDNALLHAHGWSAVAERHQGKTQMDMLACVAKYPCNLHFFQRALGIVVHSEVSLRMAKDWYGLEMAADWVVVPLLRAPVLDAARQQARSILGISNDVFLVCSFGFLAESKLNHRLVEAWLSSDLAPRSNCLLVFVGGLPNSTYGEELLNLTESAKGRITMTGWADSATYRHYLAAADLTVQLRTQSRGETSAAVLDSLNYGLPTIVNANGSMADLPEEVVYRLADEFTTTELRVALERLHSQPALRQRLGQCAAAYIRGQHLPRACAAQYAEAVERFHAQAEAGLQGLVGQAAQLGLPDQQEDLAGLAEAAAHIYPPRQPATHQILLDISGLAQHDGKTGIERVVRCVLQELLDNPPTGYRVEPIYATAAHGYRYARHFTARFLGFGELPLDDEPIFAMSGDIFWAPDWVPDVVRMHERELAMLRAHGVQVIFTVYDILPLTLPETTHPSVHEAHMLWLMTLARVSSGLICISATVMANVKKWLALFGPQTGHTIPLGWTTLGSDVIGPEEAKLFNPSPELPAQLAAMQRYPTFLMVGTVEPRKGHAQTLAAFEWLWNQGKELNLVIVGKKGWKVDELAEHLVTHPERERHLFWLQGIDDALLEQVYAASTCLIAASLDEGFGLPLIEAARHKLPILARDIPVFREVAGDHASYFSGLAPQDLTLAVLQWLAQDYAGTVPTSEAIPWLTWAESTQQMLDVILDDQWQDQWTPAQDASLVTRHWASDYRVQSVVGQRLGTALWSTGHTGHLAYGPAGLALKAGTYTATWSGSIGLGGCDDGAHADISIQQGKEILARADLEGMTQADGHFVVTLPFILKEDRRDLEVRVWVGERSDVRLDLLEIRTASPLALGRSAKSRELATANAKAEHSPSALIRRYWATHPKMDTGVGHRVGRNVHATGKNGYLLFGPYVGLPKGRYMATVFGATPQSGGLDGCWMDVAWNQGREVAVRQTLYATQAESVCELGHIAFDLAAYAPNLEIRVYVESGVSLRLDGIAIEETI